MASSIIKHMMPLRLIEVYYGFLHWNNSNYRV